MWGGGVSVCVFPFCLVRLSFTGGQGHWQGFLGFSIGCFAPVAGLTVMCGKYFPCRKRAQSCFSAGIEHIRLIFIHLELWELDIHHLIAVHQL